VNVREASHAAEGPVPYQRCHRLAGGTHGQGEELRRSIGAFALTALGVGAIIGTGIFVVIGKGAAIASPALVISFILAAVTCTFSALSYAELSSSVPISGSAYTFSYATLGELVAFIIGWDLILEYGVSVAGVAIGWGGNVNEFLLAAFGFELPLAISKSPSEGGVFNRRIDHRVADPGNPRECHGQRGHGRDQAGDLDLLHRGGVHRVQ
jgi:hypothetical protein